MVFNLGNKGAWAKAWASSSSMGTNVSTLKPSKPFETNSECKTGGQSKKKERSLPIYLDMVIKKFKIKADKPLDS
jgi:hypothetical protein